MTLPVGTWWVARKQSIRSVDDHVRNLTTSYFKQKETKFVGNKTAISSRNRSSLCLLFVKLWGPLDQGKPIPCWECLNPSMFPKTAQKMANFDIPTLKQP